MPSDKAFSRLPLRVLALLVLFVLTAALCAFLLARGLVRPDTLIGLARGAGARGMLVYVGAVIVLQFLWMPRVWGLVAGGALFGPWMGIALSISADMCSALLCYGIARSAARAWITDMLSSRPKARAIVKLLSQRRGLLMIALLRVCPIAHYTLVNYAAGAAGVNPLAFISGTVLGLIPGAVLYSFVGDSLLKPGSAVFWIMLFVVTIAMGLTYAMAKKMLEQTQAPPAGTEQGVKKQ